MNQIRVSYDNIETTSSEAFYEVRKKNKFGIIDSLGNEVLPPIYDWIFNDNPTSASFQAGLVFLLKNDSIYLYYSDYKRQIPYACDFYCHFISDSIYVIGKNQQIGIFQKGNGVIIPIAFENVIYKNELCFLKKANGNFEVYNFSKKTIKQDFEIVESNSHNFHSSPYDNKPDNYFFLAKKEGKYGVLYYDLNALLDFKYNRDEIYINNNVVYLNKGDQWICLQYKKKLENQKVNNISLLKKCTFNFDYEVVRQEEKYGVINYLGDVVIPLIYDEIKLVDSYIEHAFIVRKGNKSGLFDKFGKKIIPFSFETIRPFKDSLFLASFKGKYGLFGTNGEVILPMRYDNIFETNTNFFKVLENNEIGLISAQGKSLFKTNFSEEIVDKREENTPFKNSFKQYVKIEGDTIIINENGQEILPSLYDQVFSNSFYTRGGGYKIFHSYYMVKKDGLYGVISGTDEIVPPIYGELNFQEFNLDTLVPFKRNGKAGYLALNDMTERFYGIYDECLAYYGDYAIVVRDNKKGIIDRFGNEKIAPIYSSVGFNPLNGIQHHISVKQLNGKETEIKQGIIDVNKGDYIVPVEFMKIRHMHNPYSTFYYGYNAVKDSTYIFEFAGGGVPVFQIPGDPHIMVYRDSTLMDEAFFQVIYDPYYREQIGYSLEGKRIVEEDIEKTVQDPVAQKNDRKKEVKVEDDFLTDHFVNIALLKSTYYNPKLFGLPKSYIASNASKLGLVNTESDILIPFEFDEINELQSGSLQVKKEEKIGWLSKDGKIILPIVYDNITIINSPNLGRYFQKPDSLFHVVKNKQHGIVDHSGEIIIPAVYDTILFDFSGVEFQLQVSRDVSEIYSGQEEPNSFDVCDGDYDLNQRKRSAIENNPIGLVSQLKLLQNKLSFPVKKNGNWGLVGINGQIILPVKYDSISMVTGLIAQIQDKDEITFFDLVSNELLPFKCDTVYPLRQSAGWDYLANDKRFYIFKSNGKYGVLDALKREYLPAQFDAIEQSYCFPEYYWMTFFIEDGFYNPLNSSSNSQNEDFHSSINAIRYKLDGKYGVIDLINFKIITPENYDSVRIERITSSELSILHLGDKVKLFSYAQGDLFNRSFEDIQLLSRETINRNNSYYFRVVENSKVGVYKQDGVEVVPCLFDDVSDMIITDSDIPNQFIVRKKNKYGVIDEKGNILIPIKYESIKFNSNSDFESHYVLLKKGSLNYRHYSELK